MKTLKETDDSVLPEETVSPEELKTLKARSREAKKHPETLIPLEDLT